MGHSTSSGRTQSGGQPTLNREERESLRRIVSEDRGEGTALNASMALRQYNIQMRGDADKLDEIYSKRREDETPDQTVARFVKSVGEERAVNTVASLVNKSAWDGRIGRINRSWASEQGGALTEEEGRRSGVSTRMHMAHLDQVASAMRRYQENSRASRSAREARQVGNNNFGSQVLRRNNRSR